MRRIVFISLTIYVIVGFVALPFAIKRYAPEWTQRHNGALLSLSFVGFNPFSGTLYLEGVALDDPQGSALLRLESLRLNLGIWALARGELKIEELWLKAPRLSLGRSAQGIWSGAFLIGDHNASAPMREEAPLLRIIVEQLRIENGAIMLVDATQRAPFELQITPLDLKIEQLDTYAHEGALRLRAQMHDGGAALLRVRLSEGVGYRLEGEMTYDSGRLFTGWRYLQEMLALEVADGALHAYSAFVWDSGDANATRLFDAALRLEHLRIKPKNAPHDLLRLESLELSGIESKPLDRYLSIKRIGLEAPALFAKRLQDGSIDWSGYLEMPPSGDASASSATPWRLSVGRIEVIDGLARLEDESVTPKAELRIDAFDLHVNDLHNGANRPIGYETRMKINETGRFESAGRFTLAPLTLEGAVHLDALSLTMLNPYIAPSVALVLDRGFARLDANVSYGAFGRLSGRASLHDLVLSAESDRRLMLAFDTLSADDFDLKPEGITIETLGLHAPYAYVQIDENKSLNWNTLRKSEAVVSEAASAQKEPFGVEIAQFRLSDAAVDFGDDALPLRFHSHINEFGGTLYGISSQIARETRLEFNGVVDRYGMVKLGGGVNLFDPRALSDLELSFRNIALANMSPYSAGFAGRVIDEGKLDLDLRYKIVESQMAGENRIVIKKIKLGDTIDGTTPLPLGLAVALLEDREGVIDIDLPVEGDMDNPRFRYGAVVWGAIKNLIVKAASAPFAVLGSLLGIEGDALKAVTFEAGRSALSPPQREKLDALSKALLQRPKLVLGIGGGYAPKEDARSLRRLKFEALYAEALRQGAQADVLARLYATAMGQEALEALRRAYKPEEAHLLDEQMRQTLIDAQPLGAEELEYLARERALVVRDYLIKERSVAPAQLLLEPNGLAGADGEGVIGAALKLHPQE
ncbi:MAG: DUF748 domain-containing protein [Campylobacterales bacterium]|nr:DUF748 domain-containing protein [Campylobacterales bacterium]